MTDDTLVHPNAKPSASTEVTLAPRVDIFEAEHAYHVLADLPGVKQDDVEVRFEQGELTLHGKRHHPIPGRLLHQEYDTTHYQRSFRLRDGIAADRITAELKGGLLTLVLPKVEAAKPRKITVQGS